MRPTRRWISRAPAPRNQRSQRAGASHHRLAGLTRDQCGDSNSERDLNFAKFRSCTTQVVIAALIWAPAASSAVLA